ncbi:MAG TPA: hypothetical protein VJX92_25430 [Methylomirabilota bacterium]|nr:hypothetical protein [Methylomirabilota bacterium]
MSRHRTCIVVAMLYCLLDVAAITLANTVGVPIALAADPTRVQLVQRRGRGSSSGVPVDARTLVRAQVVAVDRETGHVAMQADGTRFEADFPPSVVADMQAGDIAFVTVNVINTKIAAITGPITSVDHDKCTVTVATMSGPFTFRMVPDKLNQMKPGDPLVLKLEVVDIGPPGGAPPPSPSPHN